MVEARWPGIAVEWIVHLPIVLLVFKIDYKLIKDLCLYTPSVNFIIINELMNGPYSISKLQTVLATCPQHVRASWAPASRDGSWGSDVVCLFYLLYIFTLISNIKSSSDWTTVRLHRFLFFSGKQVAPIISRLLSRPDQSRRQNLLDPPRRWLFPEVTPHPWPCVGGVWE